MAELSNQHKITARTAVEITEALGQIVLRYQRSPLRFHAGPNAKWQKVKIEAIVGCVMLDFLAKPTEAQDALIARRLPELQALVLGEPAPSKAETPRVTPGRKPDYVKPAEPKRSPGGSKRRRKPTG